MVNAESASLGPHQDVSITDFSTEAHKEGLSQMQTNWTRKGLYVDIHICRKADGFPVHQLLISDIKAD